MSSKMKRICAMGLCAGMMLGCGTACSGEPKKVEIPPIEVLSEKPIYKMDGFMNYYAWPSVTKIGGGKLLAVVSQRYQHVDPYGRVVGFISEDNGETWSEPFLIADTVLDDRDAGVVYWQGKIIVTWFTHSRNYYIASNDPVWIERSLEVPEEEDAKFAGGLITISEDEGKTWSTPEKIDVFTPHGIQIMPNGNLGYIGYVGYDRDKCGFTKGIGMITSADGVNWSAVTSVTGTGYDEPGYVFVDESTILVYLRKADGLYQSTSKDGGASFSQPEKIMDDVANTPAHVFTTSQGVLVMTYGHRSEPFGLQAKLSYDKGETWSEAIVLTDDGFEWDLGYSCTTELPDGTLYTVYYQKMDVMDENTCLMGVHWKIG